MALDINKIKNDLQNTGESLVSSRTLAREEKDEIIELLTIQLGRPVVYDETQGPHYEPTFKFDS